MKKVSIERLLTWAFAVELAGWRPEERENLGYGSSAWSIIERVGALGTRIDGGTPLGQARREEPQADALIAADAVMGLAARGGFDVAPGWQPFPEWHDGHGLVAAEVARVIEEQRLRGDIVNGDHVVTLVLSSAVLGHGPDWEAEEPFAQPVSMNGKPRWFVKRKAKDAFGRIYEYEADGRDPAKRRPMRGAYRKYELTTPVRGAILSRLDWQLWQDALVHLHESLAPRLENHVLLPFRPDRQPWVRLVEAA
ncbi:hypothetical protein [Mycoplana rhizolycopersici]|uniref:Uncharacterized protein n=1 Tax=Mycoplana rhizolycopersici TaxID=2746702 RepID=A0ABX2QEB5_9HYPH|nr:hypothetical protein [Rhizobium rhizolycopersici]NVP56075.1 hypothetical protein [Rhizobium rhizolycopersici]